MSNSESISIQFHPRAFAAFGADLVTNDSVAITELVKNSYDAFAYSVDVSFCVDEMGEHYIEIIDDGLGMSREIIKTAWAVIATPYKQKNPTIERDGITRRVSGNKGLGRFSAARLGRYMEITTKCFTEAPLSVTIDWDSFANSGNMSDCIITITEIEEKSLINDTGTIIKIYGLQSEWDEKKISELQNALSRLISPFQNIADFSISLSSSFYDKPIKIKPQSFIENPTYSILGSVDENGTVCWDYQYTPKNILNNSQKGSILWNEAQRGFDINKNILEMVQGKIETYSCGKFTFEIRAWDLDSDSLGDVSETFNIGKRDIKNSINQYKGLSIYRDKVLVLPKSDASKDWLGLDLRRVSSIGRRISTSQIVGIINISSKDNPEIRDTTDREKLVDTAEYNQFCRIVEAVVSTLENFRNTDKRAPNQNDKSVLNDLISPLSANTLVEKVEEAIEKGQDSEAILEVVRDYSADNEKNLLELHERLTYYAQTASLGSVAVVILHEILTGMTVVKRFLNRISLKYSPLDKKTEEYFDDSNTWHSRLVEVANSFAPLYRKTLRKEANKCNIYKEINNSIRLISSKKEAQDILINNLVDDYFQTSLHAGEFQTIMVNLLDNACYWIKKQNSQNMRKEIKISLTQENEKMVKITVSDTGPGIRNEDAEKIFQPGVTAKLFGIGMGLVIVTELLSNYDCKIATVIPGELNGATFIFELPIAK